MVDAAGAATLDERVVRQSGPSGHLHRRGRKNSFVLGLVVVALVILCIVFALCNGDAEPRRGNGAAGNAAELTC